MPSATETSHVLREVPDLADGLSRARRALAIEECVAPATRLAPGLWNAQVTNRDSAGLGLLVLKGTLIRRVGVDGRFGAELLGEGDLLRPWQGEEELDTLPVTTGWRVIEPSRVAVLDARFALRLTAYPQVYAALIGRALRRSRNLAVNMAIVHQSRVDVRIHMVLWHLAGRWGRVGSQGVVLPLRLTHSVLADLVAARRPTVTSALSELYRRGQVQSTERGWLLRGEPPGELLELAPVRVEQAQRDDSGAMPAA
jgi:CRP/FNR family transcriptional regulator, cyclic AMP receptor protein